MTRVKGGGMKMQWQDQSNPVCTPESPWGTTCVQARASGYLYNPQSFKDNCDIQPALNC